MVADDNHKTLFVVLVTILWLAGCDAAPLDTNIYENAVHSEMRSKDDKKDDVRRKPLQILAFSGIKSGMTIADISAGTGYYTEIFSHAVGSNGTVYMQNKPSYLAREDKKTEIDVRLDNGRLANTRLISSKFDDLAFPSKVDVIFISKIFHDLYLPKDKAVIEKSVKEFLGQIHEQLNDNGIVLLIDHSGPIGSKVAATSKSHRIDENYARSVFENNGFEFVSSSEILRNDKDARLLTIWESEIYGKTDRFVYKFKKK